MLKYLFCSVVFLCTIFTSLVAQDDEATVIELSSDYKIPAATFLESILYSDSESIYLLRKSFSSGVLNTGNSRLKAVIVESYDRETLKLQKAIEIDLKYQKKLRTFHEIFKVKGNLYLITSFFNSAKRKNFLFAQKLDKKFKPSEDLILIGEIDSRNEVQTGDFLIRHSRDTSKIVIFNDIPTKRNENERAEISVFDTNFESIWKKKINLPFESKLYERIKFDVDNLGNAYVLGKHYFEKRRDSRRQKPNYEFILEAYTKAGEQKDKYQINDAQKFISDLTFEVNKREQVICTGFYSDLKPIRGNDVSIGRNSASIGNPLKGIVLFNINNQEKKITKKFFTEFELDFITANLTDRERRRLEKNANDNIERNDPALFNFDFRDVILRSDGGAVIIAEEFYTYRQDNFNNDFGFNSRFGAINRNRNNFNNDSFITVFGDVIVVNINPDGSIRWANSIPKYQTILDRTRGAGQDIFGGTGQGSPNINAIGSNSFAISNYRDKIQIVFNERVDLFESDPSGFGSNLLTSNANRYGLAMATIDKDGELEIQLLASNKEMGIQALPVLTKQIGKKELIFYGLSSNNFRLGKILIE